MSDPSAAGLGPGASQRYKRKLSNYLIDKKLQLRYILVVTLLSGLIAGSLGFMIYDQRHQSTQSIEKDLQDLNNKTDMMLDSEDIESITGDYESEDRELVYKMVGAGVGLVVILSLYLVIMTHKVAGPLFKTSIYFERMAMGKLGQVTPLRRGDMLRDFFERFHEMHDAVRQRATDDVAAMEKAASALRDAGNRGDYRGDAYAKLSEELDKLETHLGERKKNLA